MKETKSIFQRIMFQSRLIESIVLKNDTANDPWQATNGFRFEKCFYVNKSHEMLGQCETDSLQKTAHIHGNILKETLKSVRTVPLLRHDRRM
jgi:hypothetical protein